MRAGEPVGSCPEGPTVELDTRPNSSFLSALPLPAFSIASPASLRAGPPVGTGPFRLASWTHGDRLVLTRKQGLLGAAPGAELSVVFKLLIPDDAGRLHALEAGEIDGYDLVATQDIPEIEKDAELKLLERPPFNVGYLTINQARPPMDKLLVRQAVAYGLDRQRLARLVSSRVTRRSSRR